MIEECPPPNLAQQEIERIERAALKLGKAVNYRSVGTVEFLFSPNLGEDLKPLVKIASGGELSRLMLALKSNLNKQDTIPVMVFDEVDTGIGGKIAEVVGSKLKKIRRGISVREIR